MINTILITIVSLSSIIAFVLIIRRFVLNVFYFIDCAEGKVTYKEASFVLKKTILEMLIYASVILASDLLISYLNG